MGIAMLPSVFAAAGTETGTAFLVLPLLAGAAAIYLLLPRPRRRPWLHGAAVGLLALLLAGVFLVPPSAAAPETILFYAFSFLAVVSGALLVTQRNPARAALSFALVVLSTCGLFLLLAAPFLMAATVIIYAGAIIVTFLFVLMLAQQEGPSDADERSREPLLASLSGFLLLGALIYVLQTGYGGRDIDRLLQRTRQARAQDTKDQVEGVVAGTPEKGDELFHQYHTVLRGHGWFKLDDRVEEIEQSLLNPGDDLAKLHQALDNLIVVAEDARNRLSALQPPPELPLSDQSGPPANVAPGQLRRDETGRPALPAENAAFLGRSLFTDFLVPVELGGTLLLVATVGAIAIAHRRGMMGRVS
jgi:NADH:ubiquinone oxidoreductase subunit 6 (subunit J)